ncbi:hypothetical protein KRX57_06280 [Weeksellaceae bacterium TAE3-ERU29]|nr:hypothetical protein [Weeksellaceae bacterium TAE3-ERU29]
MKEVINRKWYQKKRYKLSIIFLFFWVVLGFFIPPETWLVLSLPLIIIAFIYFSILWISFMFWAITGKDPIWFKFKD